MTSHELQLFLFKITMLLMVIGAFLIILRIIKILVTKKIDDKDDAHLVLMLIVVPYVAFMVGRLLIRHYIKKKIKKHNSIKK